MEMKKIVYLLAALLLGGAAASAQTVEDPVYDKFGTTFKKNGEDLSDEERIRELSDVNGMNLNPEWTKYCRQRNAGLGMLISGSALTAVSGCALVVFSDGYDRRKKLYLEDSPMLPVYRGYVCGAAVATAASAALFGAGLGIYFSANRHLESIISTANMSLGLNGSPDGVGIALRF